MAKARESLSDRTLEALVSRVRAGKNAAVADTDVIRRAWEYAESAHAGQVRESGEPYFDHPAAVAFILAEMDLDADTVAAGLLHDVVEDTGKTYDEMAALFGTGVAALVDGVTKLSRVDFKTREEQQAESLRKMFVAMARDIRVILIKLADRLHNMRTLRQCSPDKQLRVATETVEIYAPLAHRLGMWRMKWELEDLALRYLEPAAYYELVDKVATKRQEREGRIEEARQTLEAALKEIGIDADVQGRPKHFYSIYQKMVRQGKEFGEIWDLLGMRVIVDTVRECYAVLGAIHSLWKPIPGRFKDYVAMPKSNMYQSLHTTVVGPKGEPLEIQIRTWDMHRTAEYGIAAHWRYKEGISGGEFEDKITWLRQIMEWQKETGSGAEFIETLKVDLFSDEVYVFTPKGDVKALPAGSTPVDFAYAVHTDVGHRCAGARVNGRMASLGTVLTTGDIVEIIINKAQSGPSRDWLKFAKTSKAKGKIRQWVKEQRREESIEHGRELLEKELRRLGLEVHANMKEDRLAEIAAKLSYSSADDLLASIGYGKVSPVAAAGRLAPERVDKQPDDLLSASAAAAAGARGAARSSSSHGVSVQGIDNVLVRFAKCCTPVPGDAIVGYITRGRGVSVHTADCPNGEQILKSDEGRAIKVWWDVRSKSLHPVEIEMEAVDSPGLLTGVMNAVIEAKAHISAVNARTSRNSMAVIALTVEIDDVDHLNDVIQRLRRMNGVKHVHRVRPS